VGANYQYAHSIDDAGSVGGTGSVVAQNWQDIAADAGNSAFDVRHKVSGTYLYELPFGKDKFYLTTGKMSHVLEGFSISGSFSLATGTPLTPTLQASVTDVARAVTGTERLDRVPGASLTAGGGSLRRWFNTDAFTVPTADKYGNAFGTASRNLISGPGIVQNNMSLSKTMQLGETRSLEFRATADNVFNTVQYTGVNTTLPTSHDANVANGFGQVTSVGTMRSFQFSSRFRF
jgi:trimeric autotransporter adhesin